MKAALLRNIGSHAIDFPHFPRLLPAGDLRHEPRSWVKTDWLVHPEDPGPVPRSYELIPIRAAHFVASMSALIFPSRIARLSTAWSFSF
jgi:hypothetical protein